MTESRSHPRRALVAAGLACVLVLLIAGWAYQQRAAQAVNADAATSTVPVATAEVERADLVNTVPVPGALTYSGSYAVVTQRSGVFTQLPALGQVINQGQSLFEVDGNEVPLFYGDRPEWRTLSLGVADGPDVSQLKANLLALGYLEPSEGSIDWTFTWGTAVGLERWQAGLGLTATGILRPGDLVYAAGPLRVASVVARLGAAAQPGMTVFTATSTSQVVQAQLPVSQQVLVRVGDPVTVTLPDGRTTTTGKVAAVSPVAAQPQGPGANAGSEATVALTVSLDRPEAAGGLDQAPVTIEITVSHVEGVLAVPINALLALAEGGYAVEAVDHGHHHLVAVQTGLYSRTLVQVASSQLTPGMRVEVPAS